jgi:hypothetical protein
LREWEVIFDQPGDGRKPKLLYIEVSELVGNSLRATLRQGAFKESFFARSDGSTLTWILQAMAFLVFSEMTRWR